MGETLSSLNKRGFFFFVTTVGSSFFGCSGIDTGGAGVEVDEVASGINTCGAGVEVDEMDDLVKIDSLLRSSFNMGSYGGPAGI